MKFVVFCLAVWLAAICATIEIDALSDTWSRFTPFSTRRGKRSVDNTNPQNQADRWTSHEIPINVQVKPNPQPVQPIIVVQPSYQQPTTTVDPMCPEGRTGPCRELPPGQQGSIQVRNDGLVTLQFFVEYKVRGQKITKESRPFTWTLKRTIDIPTDAEDIVLTVQGIGLFGATSDILKKQWKYPVIRCYSSTDAQNVNKVGCH